MPHPHTRGLPNLPLYKCAAKLLNSWSFQSPVSLSRKDSHSTDSAPNVSSTYRYRPLIPQHTLPQNLPSTSILSPLTLFATNESEQGITQTEFALPDSTSNVPHNPALNSHATQASPGPVAPEATLPPP